MERSLHGCHMTQISPVNAAKYYYFRNLLCNLRKTFCFVLRQIEVTSQAKKKVILQLKLSWFGFWTTPLSSFIYYVFMCQHLKFHVFKNKREEERSLGVRLTHKALNCYHTSAAVMKLKYIFNQSTQLVNVFQSEDEIRESWRKQTVCQTLYNCVESSLFSSLTCISWLQYGV